MVTTGNFGVRKVECYVSVQLMYLLDISFKVLVYTLCEDKSPGCAIPSLIFHYQCVCSRVCVYDVGCFVDVLVSWSR